MDKDFAALLAEAVERRRKAIALAEEQARVIREYTELQLEIYDQERKASFDLGMTLDVFADMAHRAAREQPPEMTTEEAHGYGRLGTCEPIYGGPAPTPEQPPERAGRGSG